MKLISPLLLIIIAFTISCNSQEKSNDLMINYTAQTRGFIYSLNLEKNVLEINDNNIIKKVEISKNQQVEISNFYNEINFKEIENNISINDLAVDKAIKGTFKAHFNEKIYEYEFNHNKLPKKIRILINKLEMFAN